MVIVIDIIGFLKESFLFVVVNIVGMDKIGEVEIIIELERKRFVEGILEYLY